MMEDWQEWQDECASLLPEVWLHILSFLPPRDLAVAALTARGLGELASLPRLWAAATIRKITFRSLSLQHFFSLRRYSQVAVLDFSRIQLSEASLVQLLEWSLTSHLADLDLTGLNLSPVAASLLSPALLRLRRAQLGFTKLTGEQTCHLFSQSDSHRSRSFPSELCLKAVNLSAVPSGVLARSLARLHTANLSFTELTVDQVSSLLSLLAARGPAVRLSSLDLFSVDLSAVCPLLLARATASLTVASLSNTELRLEHCHALCDHVLHSATLLDLNLDFAELFSVPPEVLGRAMTRLDRVSLACTVLAEDQLLALASALALPASMVTQIDLLDLQLSFLPPALLLAATSRLTRVNLSGSKLSPEQADSLLAGLDTSVLREVNLDYVLLSSCCPERLAAVTRSLHTASMKKCGLTEQQLTVLLLALSSPAPAPLSSLCLHGNSLATAEPALIAAAAASLQSLDISYCLLPPDTAAFLLASLPTPSSSLRSLTLLGNRLGEVPCPALTTALASSLHRLDLSSTALTSQQLEAVLEGAGPPLKELSLFSLDLASVREGVLREAEKRVFVSHRHAAITPDS